MSGKSMAMPGPAKVSGSPKKVSASPTVPAPAVTGLDIVIVSLAPAPLMLAIVALAGKLVPVTVMPTTRFVVSTFVITVGVGPAESGTSPVSISGIVPVPVVTGDDSVIVSPGPVPLMLAIVAPAGTVSYTHLTLPTKRIV